MQDNRKQLNLIGGGFQHSPSTSGYESKYVKWAKNCHISPVTFYIDQSLMGSVCEYTKNYGWLVESKTIIPNVYEWAKNNIEILKKKFIQVFTHDVELARQSDIFKLTQCSSKSFIQESDIKLYTKTKLVSLIASNKTLCAEHVIRQNVIKTYSSNPKVDHYGFGYKPLQNKIDGLKDYYFSFAMENATYSNMYTEKITDCFSCGTIPIYYGIDNIGDFFNEDGIIKYDENFDINNLSAELYYSKIEAIKENMEISKNMLTAEDYIYLNFLKDEI